MTNQWFLIDSDVLITPKNTYYPFDYCPAYWDALIRAHERSVVYSIDRVFDELNKQQDDLTQWVGNLPEGFFLPTRTAATTGYFAPLMQWVEEQDQFLPKAKEEFAQADKADGWLIASARERGATVVTLET